MGIAVADTVWQLRPCAFFAQPTLEERCLDDGPAFRRLSGMDTTFRSVRLARRSRTCDRRSGMVAQCVKRATAHRCSDISHRSGCQRSRSASPAVRWRARAPPYSPCVAELNRLMKRIGRDLTSSIATNADWNLPCGVRCLLWTNCAADGRKEISTSSSPEGPSCQPPHQ